MEEINPIISSAGFEPPSDGLEWQRGAKNHRIDNAAAIAVFLAPVSIVLLALDRPWLAILPVIAAALLALREAFLWRFERNALSPQPAVHRQRLARTQTGRGESSEITVG